MALHVVQRFFYLMLILHSETITFLFCVDCDDNVVVLLRLVVSRWTDTRGRSHTSKQCNSTGEFPLVTYFVGRSAGLYV